MTVGVRVFVCTGMCAHPRTYRLELWTNSAGDEALQQAIGSRLKELLGPLPSGPARLGYQAFADKMVGGGRGAVKDKYSV